MVAPVALNDLAAALDLGDHELVALVGGGGKTTTLFALGHQLPGTVVLTTTTKMGRDRTEGFAVRFSPTDDEVGAALAAHGRLLAWGHDGGHKVLGVGPEVVDRWFELADHVVVEADGSRQRPFKAPADYEPVVPSQTTMLVACMGADALGRVIHDRCHRPLRVAALAGCSPWVRLRPEHAAEVLTSARGGRKGAPVGARYRVLITRLDPTNEAMVDELVGQLADRQVEALVCAPPDVPDPGRGGS